MAVQDNVLVLDVFIMQFTSPDFGRFRIIGVSKVVASQMVPVYPVRQPNPIEKLRPFEPFKYTGALLPIGSSSVIMVAVNHYDLPVEFPA